MICGKCGAQMDGKTEFCAVCGAKNEHDAEPQRHVAPQLLVDHPTALSGEVAPAKQPEPVQPVALNIAEEEPEIKSVSAPPAEPVEQAPVEAETPADEAEAEAEAEDGFEAGAEDEIGGGDVDMADGAAPRKRKTLVLLLVGLLLVALAGAGLLIRNAQQDEPVADLTAGYRADAPALADLPGGWELTVRVIEDERIMTMVHQGIISLRDLGGGVYLDMTVTEAKRSDAGDAEMKGYIDQPAQAAGYYHNGVLSFAYPGFPALFNCVAGPAGDLSDACSVDIEGRIIQMECYLTRMAGEGGEAQ